MKPEELMVGDWVIDNGHGRWSFDKTCTAPDLHTKYIKVSQYDFDKCDHYEPIPITMNILEKNDFVGNAYCQILQLDDKHELEYIPYCHELTLWEYKSVLKIIKFKATVKYVHKLQHALRFCKIYKDIKL